MKVELISSTENPTYISSLAVEIKNLTDKNRLRQIIENSKEDSSMFERLKETINKGEIACLNHVNFVFYVSDLSLLAESFLTNHRLATCVVNNNKEDKCTLENMYIPNFKFNSSVDDEIRTKVGIEYENFCKEAVKTYEFLIENGISKKEAYNVIPSSIKNDLMFTATLKETIHIINAALHGRGKNNEEIKELGTKLQECINEKLPNLFENMNNLDSVESNKVERLDQLFESEDIYCDVTDRRVKPSVELISYTEDAEELIGVTTLISHMNCSTEYARVRTNDTEFLKKLLEIVCTEPRARELETAKYTFRLNNLTLSVLKDFLENRVSSISVPTLTQIGKSKHHIVPESILNSENEEIKERYERIFERSVELYETFVKYDVLLQDRIYTYLEGDSVVDAIITMNARELYKFFRHNISNESKDEIKKIALNMLEKLKEVSPFIFYNVNVNDVNENV